jgi:hypothetical protein
MAKILDMIRNVLSYAFSHTNLRQDMMVEAALISRPWDTM